MESPVLLEVVNIPVPPSEELKVEGYREDETILPGYVRITDTNGTVTLESLFPKPSYGPTDVVDLHAAAKGEYIQACQAAYDIEAEKKREVVVRYNEQLRLRQLGGAAAHDDLATAA